MDPLLKFLEEQIGLGALALLIVVVLICCAVWKIAVAYAKKTTQIDSLPCDKHEKAIDDFGSSIQQINLLLGKLETGQEDMYKMMAMMASSSQMSQFTQSHSPISLTDKGKEIAQLLDFDKVIDDNWVTIKSIIDDEKNPYDIQMEFISRLITDPDKYVGPESMDKIKKDAYNRGVPLIEYMRMLGVMARDRYFSEHDIDVSEVDSNDPSKS